MTHIYTLLHPIQQVPAEATQTAFYVDPDKGCYIGLTLQFADGHTVNMTYAEIRTAQAAVAREGGA